MQDFGQAFVLAFGLMFSADPDLLEIIALSLKVSLTAVLITPIVAALSREMIEQIHAEERFVADGFWVERCDAMYNDVVIVRPAADAPGRTGSPETIPRSRR